MGFPHAELTPRLYRLPALLLGFALPYCATAGDDPATPEILDSWVQYTVDGAEVRVVTGGKCPGVLFDGHPTDTAQRAAPTDRHPNRVCAARVPADTQRIALDGKPLPVPTPARPERIVVLGDTGCRVSAKHGLYQACNNSSIWPFARIADSAARSAPQLIIFTGDYIYRESPCPSGNRGCAGTPWGDDQATWEADFFRPARTLLAAAPLLFVRGNHESCARAGAGWFRYLDARPYTGQCQRSTQPWLLEAGSLRLAVLDTAEVKDADSRPLTGFYAQQLGRVGELLDGRGWLVTHRPFWAFGADDDTGRPEEVTAVLQEAVDDMGLPQGIRLLIGAHLHLAEVIDFGDQRPAQLIVGNGGTQLIPATPPPKRIDGLPVLNSRVFYQYGFVTMVHGTPDNWDIAFRDAEGRDIESCRFSADALGCTNSPIP